MTLNKRQIGTQNAQRLRVYLKEGLVAGILPRKSDGTLHRGRVVQELGLGRSAIVQNPAIRQALEQFEEEFGSTAKKVRWRADKGSVAIKPDNRPAIVDVRVRRVEKKMPAITTSGRGPDRPGASSQQQHNRPKQGMTGEIHALRVTLEPRICRASDNFKLRSDEKATQAGFPFLIDTRGELAEPVHDYLAEQAVWKNAAIGTIVDQAYALKDWWTFLARRQKEWIEATDELLRAWCKEQEEANEITRSRIERKLKVVFDFYYVVQTRYGMIKDIMEDPENGRSGPQYPISVRIVVKRNRQGRSAIEYVPRFTYVTKNARKSGPVARCVEILGGVISG